MNRLNVSNQLTPDYKRSVLYDILKKLETLLNAIAEGKIAGSTNATTAAPTGTAQSYQIGDFVKNSSPSELGSAGSKYLITGWTCVTAGSPGTWKENRVLTGG